MTFVSLMNSVTYWVVVYVHVCCWLQNGPVDDGITPPRMASSRSRGLDEPHIGKYRLIKTIGKGNFAKVKLAKHVPTGREVTFSYITHYCIVAADTFAASSWNHITGTNEHDRHNKYLLHFQRHSGDVQDTMCSLILIIYQVLVNHDNSWIDSCSGQQYITVCMLQLLILCVYLGKQSQCVCFNYVYVKVFCTS